MIEADLIVTNAAQLVTCAGAAPRAGAAQGDAGVIPGGAVAAAAGKIVFAGPGDDLRREVHLAPGGAEIDAAGGVVLPGLVDPHTHLPFAGWREDEFERRVLGETYADIARTGGGILRSVRTTRAASRQELEDLMRARLDRMLLGGTTTIEAKSGYGLTLDDELKQLRAIAGVASGSTVSAAGSGDGRTSGAHPVEIVPTLLGAHVVPSEFEGRREEYVSLVAEEIIPAAASGGLAEFCDVFVEEGAFRVDEARRILEAGLRHGLKPRLHAEQFTPSGGASLAATLAAASVDHLEQVDRESAARLAAAGVVGILLPGASLFGGDGSGAPGRMLIEAGVPLAIASDFNPGTCPSDSVAAMMPLASILCGLTADEAIVAATVNAAASLNRGERIGRLVPGAQADIAVFDVPDRRHLSYRFGSARCTDVVKNGRHVVRDGRLVP